MLIIRINGTDHPCRHLIHHIKDYSWDMRDNIEMLMPITHDVAIELFTDGVAWSYIPDGAEEVVDCTEYSVAGDITDHRNGTVSVRMGKPTAMEKELADAKAALAILGVNDDDNA